MCVPPITSTSNSAPILQEGLGFFREGDTALILAVKHNSTKLVCTLLNREDAQIDAIDHYGFTALHWASRCGLLGIAKLLIEKGANCNATTKDGETPLHQAAEWGNDEVVGLLLDVEGIKIDEVNIWRSTALSAACTSSSYSGLNIIKMLVAKGADLNIRDTNGGWTPLHLACSSGRLNIVKVLVSAGADCGIRDNHGKSCFQLLSPLRQQELYAMMVEVQKENLAKAAAFLGLDLDLSSEVPSSPQGNPVEIMVRSQSILLEAYKETPYRSQLIIETGLFSLIITSPQFLSYCSTRKAQIEALFDTRPSAFLDEAEPFLSCLKACSLFYREMLQDEYFVALSPFLSEFIDSSFRELKKKCNDSHRMAHISEASIVK